MKRTILLLHSLRDFGSALMLSAADTLPLPSGRVCCDPVDSARGFSPSSRPTAALVTGYKRALLANWP